MNKYSYKIQVLKHKIYKWTYSKIIKYLALKLIKNASYHKDAIYKTLYIENKKGGYDKYSACDSWKKKYCWSQKAEFKGSFNELVVFGNTKEEIYLEVIKYILLAKHPIGFPFCR